MPLVLLVNKTNIYTTDIVFKFVLKVISKLMLIKYVLIVMNNVNLVTILPLVSLVQKNLFYITDIVLPLVHRNIITITDIVNLVI